MASSPRPAALPFATLFAALVWLALAILAVFTLAWLTRQARAQSASPPLTGPVTLTFRAPDATFPPPRREGAAVLAPGTALLTEIAGTVEARAAAGDPFGPAEPGLVLSLGAGLQTGPASQARLDYADGAVIRLGPETAVTLSAFAGREGGPANALDLETGQVWANLRSRPLEARTALGVAAAYGAFAEFIYRPGRPGDPTDDTLIINCFQGPCAFYSEAVNDIVGDRTRLTIAAGGTARTQPLSAAEVDAFIRVNPEAAALNLLAAVPTEPARLAPTEPPAPTELLEEAPPPPTQVPIEGGYPLPAAPDQPVEPEAGTPTPSATASPTATGETPEPTATSGTPGTPNGSATPDATAGTPTGSPGTPTATGSPGTSTPPTPTSTQAFGPYP